MSEIAAANIAKLRNRYHDRFTVEESINRVEYREKKDKPKVRSRYYSSVKEVKGNA